MYQNSFKLLSNNTSVNILEYLKINPDSSVTDIYKSIGIEQSVCSTFLSKLKKEGLVLSEREGKMVMYKINHSKFRILSSFLLSY